MPFPNAAKNISILEHRRTRSTTGIGSRKHTSSEDVSRDANRKMMAGADGATESDEHRPDEFFSYAFRHLIPLPILVKLFWSLHQPLPYPLMGVANQFP
jgi:hypothetical protein